MKKTILATVLLLFAGVLAWGAGAWRHDDGRLSDDEIRRAFSRQGIRISRDEVRDIREQVVVAIREIERNGPGNSKVDFAAVEIASTLDLDTSRGSNAVRNVVAALRELAGAGRPIAPPPPLPPPEQIVPPPAWEEYFNAVVNLWNDAGFMRLVREKRFSPVKISWEDIGRQEGSVWGDRISDVGIWVRYDEFDPGSARLALSVRRDNNFRDKVLVIPADQIKIHQRFGRRTVEKTLPERLRELGLRSRTKDRNVIVSNQFAIAPVPARSMRGAWPEGVPPRAAFNFSIYPYGSTNFVITDVIEGSHEAIVGPGTHQLLYANIEGEKAPFTASRAEDRPDLLRLEQALRAKGMDVDVQRYYLIQIPLDRRARGVQLSNMGTPPFGRHQSSMAGGVEGGVPGGMTSDESSTYQSAPQAAPAPSMAPKSEAFQEKSGATARRKEGLARVAIGHGEPEGPYNVGNGWRGQRAEEPIRVTVVYFVTPVGRVTRKDMENFTAAFEQWDSQAIWGGSFVTKESD